MKSNNIAGAGVLITGATKGIGQATAFAFARAHAKLILTYHHDLKAGRETAQRCKQLGAPEVFLVRLDLAQDRSILQAVKKTIDHFKKIDVLINNAGVVARHGKKIWIPFEQQTFADIEAQCRANLEGLMKLTHACLPALRHMVINIASSAGKKPYAELVPYCATKYGVRGFSQALALGFPRLKVYCVNPSTTKTQMTNFEGTAPENVARIILHAAQGAYDLPSGSDIDVRDYL